MAIISADTTKLVQLLGEQESLRLEHNAKGEDYRKGKIDLGKWLDFKAEWLTRSQDCCARMCKEKEEQSLSTTRRPDGCDILTKAEADLVESTGKTAEPLASKTKAELVAAYTATIAAETEKVK